MNEPWQTRLPVWALALSACATVYDELPEPSAGDVLPAGGSPAVGAVGGGAAAPIVGPSPSGAAAGGASGVPIAPSPATGGSGFSMAGASNAAGATAGGAPGAGGTLTGAGGAAPLPPQFPSGTELLNEDFEGDLAGWVSSPESEWEVVTDAATGSLAYQQNETSSSEPRLAVAGDATWRDIILDVDVQVVAFNGSSSSYMAGVCVRLTSPESFYLVGVRSNDGRMGVRLFGDNNTTLDQSMAQDLAAPGSWHHLRVEAVGSALTVALDGEEVLTLSDGSHAAGGIGLCTLRASARFDNVLVTAP